MSNSNLKLLLSTSCCIISITDFVHLLCILCDTLGLFVKMFTSAHTLKMECKSNFDDLFLCKCEQLHPTAKSKHLLTGQDIIDRVHSLLLVNTRQLLAAKKLIRSFFSQ